MPFVPSPPDRDQDGIADDIDGCPLSAEDPWSGPKAPDGCPANDPDGDTVLDVSDECFSEPEDADGFQDDDGPGAREI
ncbi:MAG: hypothetical protein HY905_18905 [Deltaproteobacteria bacterium]|nr:hypothetical protein [Deltaproteobacteria bacterium]